MPPGQSSIARMRTAAVIQKMKERQYDALDELIDLAQQAKIDNDHDTRLDIAKTLMPYIYPKLKHVEVDAQVNHGITVHVRNFVKPERAQENKHERTTVDITPTSAERTAAVHNAGHAIGITDEDLKLAITAGLPVSSGGHPDIIPDPVLPQKAEKRAPW